MWLITIRKCSADVTDHFLILDCEKVMGSNLGESTTIWMSRSHETIHDPSPRTYWDRIWELMMEENKIQSKTLHSKEEKRKAFVSTGSVRCWCSYYFLCQPLIDRIILLKQRQGRTAVRKRLRCVRPCPGRWRLAVLSMSHYAWVGFCRRLAHRELCVVGWWVVESYAWVESSRNTMSHYDQPTPQDFSSQLFISMVRKFITSYWEFREKIEQKSQIWKNTILSLSLINQKFCKIRRYEPRLPVVGQ